LVTTGAQVVQEAWGETLLWVVVQVLMRRHYLIPGLMAVIG